MQNTEEEKETTGLPDQFVGRDLLESYMYYRNYMPSNPIETYITKKKCIEFGKELLPSFIDPDETNEEQRVYELKASDADSCEVVKDELGTVMNNFTNQQHEQHIGALVEVDNEIFHILSMTGIVPSISPTYNEIKQEWKKQRIRERLAKAEAKL